MNGDETQAAADQLAEATRSGRPCGPVRDLLGPEADLATAYAVQQINVDRAVSAGRRISGRKIGLTSTAVQAQLGVDQPDYGVLFADTEVMDGIELDGSRLLQPRAEAEVALVLERDLDRDQHSVVDVLDAVAYALPAIEVVDSRIAAWDITIIDTIADNASCGLYVLGTRPVPLGDLDLRTLPMTMQIEGEVASTGTGAACMGHPLHAARWLADVMARLGTPLRAGECLMTGALGPMQPIGPGAVIEADLGPLGIVTTRLGG